MNHLAAAKMSLRLMLVLNHNCHNHFDGVLYRSTVHDATAVRNRAQQAQKIGVVGRIGARLIAETQVLSTNHLYNASK